MSKTTIPQGYRELTHAEIVKLGQEMDARQTWHELRDLIRQYYDEKAVLIEIEVEAEYNDEGGTDDRIVGIDIMDAHEQKVTLDLNTSWVQKEIDEPDPWNDTGKRLKSRFLAWKAEDLPIPPKLQEDIDEYLGEMAEDRIGDHIREILPAEAKTYDLRVEPAVSHEFVLVPIGAEQEREA